MLQIVNDPTMFGCNVAVVRGISSSGLHAKTAIKILLSSAIKHTFYVMADAQVENPKDTSAFALQKYIAEHNLGPMIESDKWYFNEAHGPRFIKIYIWRPDWESQAVKDWLEANKDIKPYGASPW